MDQALHQILKNHFGFNTFRPLQLEIIKATMAGQDVLALMPTGGGKSLCYQIPGLAKEGLCLVISPLIALMNDQVQNLRKRSITAFAIHSGLSRKEVVNILKTATHSNCKFLYVSPERLETSLFQEYLPALDVNLIVVDEAHCISQWGYDFRPPYLNIADIREELAEIPVMALTASATERVQQDICEKLSLDKNNFKIFRQSFERPNLSYSVFNIHSRINKIIQILNNVQGSSIIYCKTRKRTKEVAELLQMQNISADYYNAGLSSDLRTKKQQDWIQNKTRAMVCTNAFGMGIDKPDVRSVIHADVPDCLENYYQEAGRAGRDGKRAFAVLLFDEPEIETLKNLPDVRYPDIETVRTIYQAVVNYLQIPEGEEPGEYYDFDLKDFIKKFNLNIQSTIYGLKALEQDGWLSFNEQVFFPSTVRFTTYKSGLYDYEKNSPHLEPLIKTLLRTYEGIFDYPASISESYLAFLLKTETTHIQEQLTQLHFDRIIDYQPQKDMPQIYLNRTRIKTSLLRIDNNLYAERKQVFTDRVKKIIAYCLDTNTCRSKTIGNYFGDDKLHDCGICDNCLGRKKSELTVAELETITNYMKANTNSPLSTIHILKELNHINKEHIWTAINFLVEEGKLLMQADGKLKWK